jgi:hypothetical protein
MISFALVSGAVALIAGAASLFRPQPAQAHCDSVDGPVVSAARQALESGDVTLVLPYVKPEAEAELTAAFRQAREARRAGGMAAQTADRWFFETAVRLHRAGEGAPYTGLKDEADVSPALEAAERALATGSLAEIHTVLDRTVKEGVAHKYQSVIDARAHAAQEGTVAAHRERVEAELAFEKYVEDAYHALQGLTADGAGTDGGHAHTVTPQAGTGN